MKTTKEINNGKELYSELLVLTIKYKEKLLFETFIGIVDNFKQDLIYTNYKSLYNKKYK